MANFKNNKPKRIKGCCGMCACQDRDQGLRNKRLPTIQEQRNMHEVTIEETDLQLLNYDLWSYRSSFGDQNE
jgi:hypothetical protein